MVYDNTVKCYDGADCKDCAHYLDGKSCKYMEYVQLSLQADWYILHETNIDVSQLD